MSTKVEMASYQELYDYRCRVFTLYRERALALQAGEDPAMVLERFRVGKDTLFASHAQSALDEEQKRAFQGLCYFPYNPALRFIVQIDTLVEPLRRTVANANETMTMTRVGQVHFRLDEKVVSLSLYWLDVYGGGLFLPFRDRTCPAESYGGGRYLLDTIKGSDFLQVKDKDGRDSIVLDFNYAYNPSCAYNVRWVCPLAPEENRVDVAIPAGEMKYKME